MWKFHTHKLGFAHPWAPVSPGVILQILYLGSLSCQLLFMYHFHFLGHFIINTLSTRDYGIYAEMRKLYSMMNSLSAYTDLLFSL